MPRQGVDSVGLWGINVASCSHWKETQRYDTFPCLSPCLNQPSPLFLLYFILIWLVSEWSEKTLFF